MISPSDLRARLIGAAACTVVVLGVATIGHAEKAGDALSGGAIGKADWHLDPAPF